VDKIERDGQEEDGATFFGLSSCASSGKARLNEVNLTTPVAYQQRQAGSSVQMDCHQGFVLRSVGWFERGGKKWGGWGGVEFG